jgi:glycerol kinase
VLLHSADKRILVRYIMAIDQGTSSSRVVIYDPLGQQLGAVQHEVTTTFPQDGWVEQDPEVLWLTTLSAGREALARLKLTGADIAAIGITNQRETTLVWDRDTGKCLHNAIVWQDRRTAAQCAQMRAEAWKNLSQARRGS